MQYIYLVKTRCRTNDINVPKFWNNYLQNQELVSPLVIYQLFNLTKTDKKCFITIIYYLFIYLLH